MFRLGLGTAQFGLNYGISNPDGKVLSLECQRILRRARAAGLGTIDTAQAYGTAELALGEYRHLRSFNVVTKAAPGIRADELALRLRQSLEKLGLRSLYALLLHASRDISPDVLRELLYVKEKGLVKKIGVSVYSPQELAEVMKVFTPDVVQLPLNLFDQRFDKLAFAIPEVHVRSVFLQGVFFLKDLPPSLARLSPAMRKLVDAASLLNVPPWRLALEYVKQKDWVSTTLVGVTKARELDALTEAWAEPAYKGVSFDGFRVTDETLVNPAYWKV